MNDMNDYLTAILIVKLAKCLIPLLLLIAVTAFHYARLSLLNFLERRRNRTR